MPMQVIVQAFSDGQSQVVPCEPGDRMKMLFQKISDIRGVEIQYLKLVYAGKEYRHNDSKTCNKTLGDIGMKDRSMVQVVTRQPGGNLNRL